MFTTVLAFVERALLEESVLTEKLLRPPLAVGLQENRPGASVWITTPVWLCLNFSLGVSQEQTLVKEINV
jgi:hypothetical protein